MAQVTVMIATNGVSYPSYQTYGGLKFTLSGKSDQIVTDGSNQAVFSAVPTGTHAATVQMVDGSNAPFGPIASADLVVTDPGQTLQVPVNISYSQTAG